MVEGLGKVPSYHFSSAQKFQVSLFMVGMSLILALNTQPALINFALKQKELKLVTKR